MLGGVSDTDIIGNASIISLSILRASPSAASLLSSLNIAMGLTEHMDVFLALALTPLGGF